MSPRTFARRFRAETGTTPYSWLTAQRLLLAERLLEETDEPVEIVAERAGFGTAACCATTSASTGTPHRRRSGARSDGLWCPPADRAQGKNVVTHVLPADRCERVLTLLRPLPDLGGTMKRIVALSAVAVLAVAPFTGGSIAQGVAAAPRAATVGPSPTQKVAGPQHWCGSQRHHVQRPGHELGRGGGLRQGRREGHQRHAVHRPRRARHAVLLEPPGSGQRRHLPGAPAQGPADAASAGRQRRDRSRSSSAPTFWLGHAALRQRGVARTRTGWRWPGTRRFPASRTATRTSTRTRTRTARTTSASARARPSWRCSSTRRAGLRGRPA